MEVQALQKLLVDKEAEIERLKGVIEDLSDHGVAAERMELLKAQRAEIERMRALVSRAADALGNLSRCFLVEDASVDWELIAQLRKAAQ